MQPRRRRTNQLFDPISNVAMIHRRKHDGEDYIVQPEIDRKDNM